MLRSRTARHEEPMEEREPEPALRQNRRPDPEQEAILADSVGLALLVVLDRLVPAERLAFVLHDIFAMPFEEIASIIGRSPDAARQLASRARRRVQGAATVPREKVSEQRKVVDAFLRALRSADFDGLIALLDPGVVVHIDEAAGHPGALREIRGADNWARGAMAFSPMAGSVQAMLVDGTVGLVWAPHGHLARVLRMTVARGKIVEVDSDRRSRTTARPGPGGT